MVMECTVEELGEEPIKINLALMTQNKLDKVLFPAV